MDLAKRKCVPCEEGTTPLGREAARKLAAEVPLWTINASADRLSREFVFRDFKRAMAFVNRVADLAEEQNHHPDIHVHYHKVELVLWTHAAGGLHDNDFILAARIDRLGKRAAD